MKKWLTISILFSFASVHAQTIERFVVSSGGASVQSNGYNIDMTLGETIGNYFSSSDFIITPGFQQGVINKRAISIFLTGSIVGNKIVLTWSMPFEKNSSVFYIQKQKDTLNSFYEIDSIHTKSPGGNAAGPVSYTYADDYPIQGVSGYRIKLVLRDGSVYYSNTIQVIYKGAIWWLSSLYPNPARAFFNVKLFAKEFMSASYIICDAEGKIFYTGTKTFEKGFSEVRVTLATLPSGTYFFKIRSLVKEAPDLVARFLKMP